MTGAFVRVQDKNKKWVNIEIDECTDEQLDIIVNETPEMKLRAWTKFLAAWIRDNVITAHQVG